MRITSSISYAGMIVAMYMQACQFSAHAQDTSYSDPPVVESSDTDYKPLSASEAVWSSKTLDVLPKATATKVEALDKSVATLTITAASLPTYVSLAIVSPQSSKYPAPKQPPAEKKYIPTESVKKPEGIITIGLPDYAPPSTPKHDYPSYGQPAPSGPEKKQYADYKPDYTGDYKDSYGGADKITYDKKGSKADLGKDIADAETKKDAVVDGVKKVDVPSGYSAEWGAYYGDYDGGAVNYQGYVDAKPRYAGYNTADYPAAYVYE